VRLQILCPCAFYKRDFALGGLTLVVVHLWICTNVWIYVRLLQGEGEFHQYLETEVRALLCLCYALRRKKNNIFLYRHIGNILRLKLPVVFMNTIINMTCLPFLVHRVWKKIWIFLSTQLLTSLQKSSMHTMLHLHLIKFSTGSSKCFIAFLDVAARQSKVALCRWLKNHNALHLFAV
jgi:hypothetical protein